METTEKEAVRRYYEFANAGSPERFDEICSPDLMGHAGARVRTWPTLRTLWPVSSRLSPT